MRMCVVGVLTVVLGAGLSACSSDEGTESSTPDVCASADALRGSLTALGEVQIAQEGTDALATAWTAVKEDWAQLADDARAQYADQVDGVQAAADAVQSALDSARNTPSAQTLGDTAAAVGVFRQDAAALAEEVRSTC
jgi:hypothetical protein